MPQNEWNPIKLVIADVAHRILGLYILLEAVPFTCVEQALESASPSQQPSETPLTSAQPRGIITEKLKYMV